MNGKILSLNIKSRNDLGVGLPKSSVREADLYFNGFEGDFNHYRNEAHQGTLDRAVSIIPMEIIQDINSDGWPVKIGDLGENITSVGIPYSYFLPGKILHMGKSEIQLTEEMTPCKKLANLDYVGQDNKKEFIRLLNGRRGWYAKVLLEGKISDGDQIIF